MQVPGYEHSLIVKNTFIDIFEEKADETREPRSLSEPPAARPAIESGEAQNTPEALCRMQSLEQEQPMPGACPDWSMRQAPCSSTGSASHLDHLSLQEIAFPDEELLSESSLELTAAHAELTALDVSDDVPAQAAETEPAVVPVVPEAVPMHVLHEQGRCIPCLFHTRKTDGCRKGRDCEHCHLCTKKDAKKRRNRLQLEKRKQPRPQLSSPPEE